MIHAVHIFTRMRPDPFSESFLDFLASYDRAELSVTVLLPLDSPFVRQVENTGHSPVLLKSIGDAPYAFLRRKVLKKELRRLAPQIIHVYDARVSDALRKIGIPTVVSLLSIDSARYKRSPHTFAAFSPWAKERFLERGIPAEQIALLPPGVRAPAEINEEETARLRNELGFLPEDIVVGAFHPLNKSKGFPLFLAAAAMAKNDCPNLKFLVVGNGSMRHQYMRKAVSLGLKRSIRFLSESHDSAPLESVINIGMELSENAPLRRHTLRAMSMSKPVIAFDSGGNSYMVENGITGLLIRQFSSKKIAGAILELALHPQIAAQMGAAGKKRMLRLFSSEAIAKETAALYRHILSTPSSPTEGGDLSNDESEKPQGDESAG